MATRDEDFVRQVFVCDTLTPVLFFSSRGMAYKLKVYRCLRARPRRAARPWSTCSRCRKARPSPRCCRCPRTRRPGATMDVMFATSTGTVRRNRLSDFVRVQANGKIAMKLEDEGSWLVGVKDLRRERRRLAGDGRRQGIRFPVIRHPRLRRAQLGRRARHQADPGRRGHLHVDPAPRQCDAPTSGKPTCAMPTPGAVPRTAENGEDGRGGVRVRGTDRAARSDAPRGIGERPSSSSFRLPTTAWASAPRPTSTGCPAAAGRG